MRTLRIRKKIQRLPASGERFRAKVEEVLADAILAITSGEVIEMSIPGALERPESEAYYLATKALQLRILQLFAVFAIDLACAVIAEDEVFASPI